MRRGAGIVSGCAVALLAACGDSIAPVPPDAWQPGECADYRAAGHWAGVWTQDRPPQTITIAGNWAYIPDGQFLRVLDLTIPDSPQLVSELQIGADLASFRVHGPVAYAVDAYGLAVFDLRDPARPRLAGTEVFFDGVYDVDGTSDYAYVATGTGLQVVDVRDPAHPRRSGGLTLELPAYRVQTVGTYVYASLGYGAALLAVDVSAPEMPRIASRTELGQPVLALAASAKTLVVAGGQTLGAVDVTVPGSPRVVDRIEVPGQIGAITAADRRVYTTSHVQDGNQTGFFDLSSGGHLAALGSLPLPGYIEPVGVATRLSYVYVADPRRGVQIVAAPRPPLPAPIAVSVSGEARDVAGDGNWVFVAAGAQGLVVVDAGQAAAPVVMGRAGTPGPAEGIAVAAGYAYVAAGNAGLQVFDISNPAFPQRAGGAVTPFYAQRVAVADGMAYVTDYSNFQIVDVSVPTAPRLAGSLSRGAYDLDVQDGYAYLASGGLIIVDVHDPAVPAIVSATPELWGWGVTVQGTHAYLVGAELRVVDVSDPRSPQQLAAAAAPDEFRGVDLAGSVVYAADLHMGPVAFDVRDARHPTVLGSSGAGNLSWRVSHTTRFLCVADGNDGVVFAPLQCE